MEFQYAEDFKKLSILCPPARYRPKKITVFRWVFDQMDKEENFLPPLKINPNRRLKSIKKEDQDKEKCDLLALSMFDSEINARNRFKELLDGTDARVFKTLGTNVAKGDITENDGVNSHPDSKGHFNHHSVSGCQFEKRFLIISSLRVWNP